METFGGRLKAAREAGGVSLKEIAAATKISVSALDALERNDFSRLPGGIFGRAFIRAYAVEVGLDPEATVRDFQTEMGRNERDASTTALRPEVTPEDREFLERQRRAAHALRIGVGVIVLGLIAFGLSQTRTLWQRAVPPAASAAKPDIPLPIVRPPAAAPATAPVSSLTIDLQATSDCWIRIVSDGRSSQMVLRPGERKQITADREVVLDVGNAGALTWSINGKAAKALGPAGTRRQATVTPSNVESFVK
jgi:cytoskeleton protein RodZ